MRIDVFVIVARGQFAELPVETMLAGIVGSSGTPAVASPVAERVYYFVQQGIVRIDGAAFAHGYVMRRIKRRSAEMSHRTRFLPLSIVKILRTERVAIVFYQPKSVRVAKKLHRLQIEGISQRMSDHYGFRFRRQSFFKLIRVDVVFRYRYIDEHRNRSVLNDRRYRCRESAGDGNYFVAPFDSSLAKSRRGKRHERQQIRRRSRIGRRTVFHAQPFGETFFEPLRPMSRRQPEIQRGIHQIHHFLFVEMASAVIHESFALFKGLHPSVNRMVIFPSQLENPFF